MTGRVLVHPDADVLAAAVAARAVGVLADAVQARGTAHLVLTGGGTGTAVAAALGSSPASAAVDWTRVDVWWGDERFVACDDDDRNDADIREVLLEPLGIPADRVHAVAASDQPGVDLDWAVQDYTAQLAAHGAGQPAPAFDVLLLGVGPDGHVASLFPGRPGLDDPRPVVGVRDSPKPPPERVTLGLSTLRRARNTWLVVSGEGKADAVATARAGAPLAESPAAHVAGTEDTVWFLDQGAASRLSAA